MKHQIKCYGNTCPDRKSCALYAIEAEVNKTEPDEKPNNKCEFFKEKGEVLIKSEAQSAKDVRLQHYIDSIKAGGRPILIGVEISTELYEELLSYVKDEDYRRILKSRVPKK